MTTIIEKKFCQQLIGYNRWSIFLTQDMCSITLIQSAKDGSLSLVSMLNYYKT